jgi:hypothetical protein
LHLLDKLCLLPGLVSENLEADDLEGGFGVLTVTEKHNIGRRTKKYDVSDRTSAREKVGGSKDLGRADKGVIEG